MKKIIELAEIVRPNRLKHIKVLGHQQTLTDDLYHMVVKGEVTSDEEALEKLGKGVNSRPALYQVKSKLHDKLIDSIFTIDLTEKNHTEFQKAEKYCIKHIAFLELSRKRGAYENIKHHGNKVLKIALKYNFASIVSRVSALLIKSSYISKITDKELDEFYKLHVEYKAMDELEILTNYYYQKIVIKFLGKRFLYNKALSKEIDGYVRILEDKISSEKHTSLTYLMFSMLKIRSKEITNEYEAIIDLALEGHAKLSAFEYVPSNYFYAFLSKKMEAEITLRNYEEAKATSLDCLKLLRQGQPQWFTLQENIIILNFYQQNYAAAFEVYTHLVNVREYRVLNDSRKEIFKVYRAYFQFFVKIGMLSLPPDTPQKHAFRYAKFCNEVPSSSLDKQGINITVIIAQFLLLFIEEKYDLAYAKIKSTKAYAKKHLSKNESFRPRCFLKLLTHLVECDFHKEATVRKTQAWYKKLKNHPANAQRASSHVEILPFELLWELILERIDNSFRGSFKANQKRREKGS